LGPWELWGRWFKGVLLARQKDFRCGDPSLAPALERFQRTRFICAIQVSWRTRICLESDRESAKARRAIDNALEIAIVTTSAGASPNCCVFKARFCSVKTLRGGVAATERCFLQSLDWARRQEALSWELRTATSLARLRDGDGRVSVGRATHCVRVLYRFTEGFDTVDLQNGAEPALRLGGK